MKITQTKAEDLKREYQVVLTAEEISRKEDERLKEIGADVEAIG